ncbi:MAG: glycosyltransferase family 4 protein [Nitrososphaerota archaeon]|nr:glycosyltransferase family 4 protein [Nitrososphaerota archaeon]
MRIGIDCHVLNGKDQGTASVLLNFLEHVPSSHEYFLYSFDTSLTKRLFDRPQFVHRGLWMKSSFLRIPFLFPYLAAKDKCDFFHFNYYSPPLGINSVILTVHDLIYLDFPMFSPRIRRLQFDVLTRLSTRTAKHIITVSEYSKGRIIHHFRVPDSKISIVPNGLANSWFEPDLKSIASAWLKMRRKLPNRYALMVGRLDPRKNVPLAARVVRQLVKENLLDGLIVVGPPDFGTNAIFAAMESDDTLNCVTHISGLSKIELQAVYKNAEFLLYLSLAEGFGMPLIEAMAMRTPIIASNRTAIPEVCGQGGLVVELDDFPGIIGTARRLLSDREMKSQLVEREQERVEHFSAYRTSQMLSALYTRLSE